jgi:hypothetical protein
MDKTIRNAIVGHATKLPVEDLYIHIPDSKLLEAIDNMTFDHGTTAVDLGAQEKVPSKSRQNGQQMKKVDSSFEPHLTKAAEGV